MMAAFVQKSGKTSNSSLNSVKRFRSFVQEHSNYWDESSHDNFG
jgi:hypothetical protein